MSDETTIPVSKSPFCKQFSIKFYAVPGVAEALPCELQGQAKRRRQHPVLPALERARRAAPSTKADIAEVERRIGALGATWLSSRSATSAAR